MVPVRELASLAGRVASCLLAIGAAARVFTRSMHADINRAVAGESGWSAFVRMSAETRVEIEFWLAALPEHPGSDIWPQGPQCPLVAASDASDSHGAAWLADRDTEGIAWRTRSSFVPDVWERTSQRVRHGRQAFSAEQAAASSMERELRAIDANLSLFAAELRHEHVLWWTDSQNAYWAMRRGTRHPVANDLVKSIYRTCMRFGIVLFVEWVPRERSTRADELSKSEELRVWSLDVRIFREAQRRSGVRCTVDRFASVEHHLLPRFNVKWYAGWEPGGCAEAVDAYTQRWDSEENWLNPPFSQLARALSFASDQAASGLVLVPFSAAWQYSAWWSRVFSGERPLWAVEFFDVADLASHVGVPLRSVFQLAGRAAGELPQAYIIRFDFSRSSF